MERDSYQGAFRRYENARSDYARVQEQIREFLAAFTGVQAADEDPFTVTDLGQMEGLRIQRDRLFQIYTDLEQDIFERLSKRWGGDRHED